MGACHSPKYMPSMSMRKSHSEPLDATSEVIKSTASTSLVGSGPPSEALIENSTPRDSNADSKKTNGSLYTKGVGSPKKPWGSKTNWEGPLMGPILRQKFIMEQRGKIDEYYDLDEELGRGTYGKVSKCICKSTNSVRAVKQLSKTHKRYMDWVRQEAKFMKLVDHPNIIRLFETFEDSKNVYLVMDLCAGGALVDYVKKQGGYLTELQVTVLMRQILRTVAYLHRKGICHRDLKPENFLLLTKDPIEKNVLKIIDFGVSCRFHEGGIIRDKAGTPYYTSPQVLEGRYTEACDLWSCGVIMFILLSGVPPFEGKTDLEVIAKIQRGNFAFFGEKWKKVSEEAKNLIRGLMKYKEYERYTAYQALNHEAIQRYAPRGKDVKLRASIIESLRNYAFSTNFKKAALHAVVQASREDQVAKHRENFLALDIDDDGFVTRDELETALSKAGLQPPADLDAITTEVDVGRTGSIDYSEFIAATMEESHYLREDICFAAFMLFDRNGDGKISQEELENALADPYPPRQVSSSSELGYTQPQAVAEILKEADADGDGAINFEDFMKELKKGCKSTTESKESHHSKRTSKESRHSKDAHELKASSGRHTHAI